MDIMRKDTEAVTHDVKIIENEHLKNSKMNEIFKLISDDSKMLKIR